MRTLPTLVLSNTTPPHAWCHMHTTLFYVYEIQTQWHRLAADAEEDKEAAKAEAAKYTTFWNEFGKPLKLGIIEDASNRGRLAKLLRFRSSKSPDKLTSLDEYVSRMKDGQKTIYYLAGVRAHKQAVAVVISALEYCVHLAVAACIGGRLSDSPRLSRCGQWV